MAPLNAPKLSNLQILNPKPGMAVYISILYIIYYSGLGLGLARIFGTYKALGGIQS